MKNIYNLIKKVKFLVISCTLLVITACSLEEDVYSIYTPETFYSNEAQVLSSLSGIYRNFAATTGMGVEYRCLELPADQVVVHEKIQGWWGGANFAELMEHTWTPSHAYIAGTWNSYFRTVGQTNALIASLESSALSEEEIAGPLAELHSLRAYAYFFLMDLFGNVPIFTLPKVDALNLPEQNTRAEVFDFVTSELIEASKNLPTKAASGDGYYGRFTKEAAQALLATIYLNAEVYTGTSEYELAEKYADSVINSNAYSLLPDYFDNFVYNNQNNNEFIFGAIYSPDIAGGIGHPLVQKVLPGIQGGLFGLPYTPQNGFGTRPSILALYEDEDDRKKLIIPYGELKDPRTGETVMVERIVPDNNSVLYKEGVSSEGPVPYEIIPATGIRLQPMNAGLKWIKWGLDPNTNGGNAGNDIAFIRFADILLIKAEALARQGKFDLAKDWVNRVRLRSHANQLDSVTLDDILNERGRELAFEMSRRRDLIRFGKFGDAWEFKEVSEPYRTIFPIPKTAIESNPKLTQNPGYPN
ncbi:RagB/SusD family nutrient uptake outer membrane protein [Aestuariibaculum sediminum]|uniref:RagB/SusD family nutrient uptake outer membrane protein n=1 Tax=Aestuariibaculum sediminum TaxID=2770637 RepID=A0A8J6Q8G9_9FLAO|nr:RagB/SusD family nutrient uptake outer membrane protein [Aestuariibaculum sediminum]MBD0831567.1 RagB/SusD family nutrient uptake outer membrane protein [Aestuariibaculum sediminum]